MVLLNNINDIQYYLCLKTYYIDITEALKNKINSNNFDILFNSSNETKVLTHLNSIAPLLIRCYK